MNEQSFRVLNQFLNDFFLEISINYSQMKNILPKQLADETDNEMEDLEKQLKQCSSLSGIEINPSAKKSSAKTIEISIGRLVQNHLKPRHFNPTQDASSPRMHPEATFDESANSLMISKSTNSYAPNQQTLVTKRGGQLKNRKKKWKELKDVILTQKVNNLKEIFCRKIKRNNPYSRPVHSQFEQDKYAKSFLDRKGIQLKQYNQKLLSILFIYNIVSSIFVFTISMVFPQIREQISIRIIQAIGALLFLLQIVLNFTTVKFSLGRKLQNINQISADYTKRKFPIDCINMLIIIAYLSTQSIELGYFRLITLLKLSDCMQKLQKLEIYFIQNYYNQQYWSLFKVFLFNFCFAHMLAIVLIAMTNVNPNSNWLVNKNLANAYWFQKYIWSYYWGTTIMLTIGFGDMTPVCYQQACCMIFIETISCMVLAYNINCVGSLIANIRSQDIQKSKNMKIFKKLSDKHGIDESLSWKINNYIEEHANIKKLFNIEEEVQFVEKLPTAFRTDYLKQANKTIFQKLFFFNHLMQKTLFSLAEKIQMKINHPQEVILNFQKNNDIFILKNGQIGYTSKKVNRRFNHIVIDRMKVEQNGSPFLLNTNFITKNRAPYGIKSLVYSVLYYLNYDNLIEILKETHLDYELYCRERDKNKNKIDQFEVFPCQYCPQKHTKFLCPKLHFVPIQQHIMNKWIQRKRIGKNVRNTLLGRIDTPKQSSLKRFLCNKEIYDQKKHEEAVDVDIKAKKMKKQKFVIDQLKSFENDENKVQYDQNINSKTHINMQAMTKMQTKFFQTTTQMIKLHLNKAFAQGKAEDEVWQLELDKMKNYKYYFPQNNPCNLVIVFDQQQRLKKKLDKDVCEAIAKTFTNSNTHKDLIAVDNSNSMIFASSFGNVVSFN